MTGFRKEYSSEATDFSNIFIVGEIIEDKGLKAEVTDIRDNGETVELLILSIDRSHWERFFTEGVKYPLKKHEEWGGCWNWELADEHKNNDDLNDFSYVQCMIQLFDDHEPYKLFAAVS